MAQIISLLGSAVLQPRTTTFPLTEAAEAHRRLEGGAKVGKLVLTID